MTSSTDNVDTLNCLVIQISVEQRNIDPTLLDHLQQSLRQTDPYQTVVKDHRALLQNNHHAITFIAMHGEPVGYALLYPASHPSHPAVLDIVTIPDDNELPITSALLEATLGFTSQSIIWWTRAPRTALVPLLAATFNGSLDRVVHRMERSAETTKTSTLQTHAFTEEKIDEVVRINNEAFVGHPDRAELQANDIRKTLQLLGNRYTDFRIADGGFCWMKQLSSTETELFVLAVDNAHRGIGLGRDLLYTAIAYARTHHGSQKMSLYVEHTNTRAISLYEHEGFTNNGESLHSVLFPIH